MDGRLIVTGVTVTPHLAWLDDKGEVTPIAPAEPIVCGLGQLADVAEGVRADLPRIEADFLTRSTTP